MENNEWEYGQVVKLNADGTQRVVATLSREEYEAVERAMQWPEDLAKWDRLNTPIKGHEMGMML